MRLPCVRSGDHGAEAGAVEVVSLAGTGEMPWAVADDHGPLIRPGMGSWVCGDCPFFATSFALLVGHVYDKHVHVQDGDA
jgi:hypothetical protein